MFIHKEIIGDITIVLVLIISFANAVCGEQFHFSQRMKTDTYENMNVFSFETLIGQGINDCKESCKSKNLCKFISYHLRAKLCFLIGVQNDENLQTENYLEVKSGFYFGDKRDWNMEDVCKNEEDTDCPDSGCQPPGRIKNSISFGNVYSVGKSTRYKCVHGFRTHMPDPGVSTCLKNGTWSLTNINCLPETVFGEDIHEFNGKFYSFSQQEESWDAANESCTLLNGRLVNIKSQEENDFIMEIITTIYEYACYWINGRRIDGVIRWFDGTAFTSGYTNWYQGQPSSVQGDEDCVALPKWFRYMWNDAPCNFTCNFICEFI